jgi:WD40 repeat protein
MNEKTRQPVRAKIVSRRGTGAADGGRAMVCASQVRRALSGVVLVLLLVCCSAGTALGITYDKTPRQTILLSDSTRFIAEDGWNSMALYRVSDASLMQRFKALSQIAKVAITSDEKFLLIACENGSLSVWEVDTGQRVWQQSRSESGLTSVYDASFAANGESCIVCDVRDQAASQFPS